MLCYNLSMDNMQDGVPGIPEQNYNQNPEGFNQSSPYGHGSFEDPSASVQKPKLGNDEKVVLILVGLCVVLGVLFGILTRKPEPSSQPEERRTQDVESKYEEITDSEFLDLFNRTPDNLFADLNGMPYELYRDSSASSDEDALDKIKAMKGDDASALLSSESDDRYTVIISYEDYSGEWISEYWVLYKDSVFDVVNETFNADESYYWGNTDNRLENFLDRYMSIQNTDAKILSSEFTEDTNEYKYVYYYFEEENEGPDVVGAPRYIDLYESKIVIDKETRKLELRSKRVVKKVEREEN